MKLLWLGTEREDISTYYFRKHLEKIMKDDFVFNDSLSGMQEIKADLVIVYGFFTKHGIVPSWDVRKLDCPKALIINDPIQDKEQILHFMTTNKIDAGFLVYWNGVHDIFRGINNCKLYHFPYSIDTSIFYDMKLKRKLDIFFAGVISEKWYPVRTMMLRELKGRKDINFLIKIGHPFNAKTYATFINRAKIFPFTSGILTYSVAKFFEGMACNTLTLCNRPGDVDNLHFENGFNYVEINANNYMKKIDYYLHNEDERKRIALNGLKTIQKYHTIEIRAEEFLKNCKDIIENV